MFKRATKAQVITHHIQGLARTVYSSLASVLHKAVVIYVLPSILYRIKAWYIRQKKPSQAHTSEFVNICVK
jgi:hypothetical protein